MTLITRFSRLMRADLHAVMDRIEEPDVLLRQAVREMQDAQSEDEQGLATLGRERDALTLRLEELAESLTRIAAELDLCFESGREDLARRQLRRRLEVEALQRNLERRQQELGARRESLAQRVTQNRSRLESMRQKADLLAEQVACSQQDEACTHELAVSDDDVDLALLREKQRRAGS